MGKEPNELFVEESADVQKIVRQLMTTHHNPAKPHKGIKWGRPFCDRYGKAKGAHWEVVADEHPGSDENRKIPFVCAYRTRSNASPFRK
jgi:hypothetical protein